jgi:hypothetical protein
MEGPRPEVEIAICSSQFDCVVLSTVLALLDYMNTCFQVGPLLDDLGGRLIGARFYGYRVAPEQSEGLDLNASSS